MLSLPRGINRSVSTDNSDPLTFCDWLEADSLLVDEELSETDVVDYLVEQKIYDSQGLCSQFVSNAWVQIKQRLAWMGTNAPAEFRDRFIIRRVDWRQTPAYSFCMVVSLGPKYREWGHTFGSDYTEQGALFESITYEAMKDKFRGWGITPTGWTRDRTSNLADVVGGLVTRLCERTGKLEYASDKAHEAGVDVVWHLHFADQRGGAPVFLTQCASGENWHEKLATPNIGQWRKIIDFASGPYKAFAIPFMLEDKDFRARAAQIEGLMLDRYRLLMHEAPEKEWMSNGLRKKLVCWLKPRIDWLCGRE
jgi:hypothetical protein